MQRKEKVSIIIQNWNGEKHLEECLTSIFRQNYKNIEVIVVDSASRDKSVELVKKKFKKVKIIALKKDRGAPYANNLGCTKSTGKYIMFLNNDTKLQKDTIDKLVKKIQDENEEVIVSPVQLDWAGKRTGAGCPHYWIGGDLHKLFRIKGSKPFYLSISCCMLTRDMFNKNKFNENLFFYEEVEWSWRFHLKKIKIAIVENSFFHHKVGGTVNSPKSAFNTGKSITATHFICFKSHTFIFFLPLVFYNYIRLAVADMIRSKKPFYIKELARGIASFVKNIDKFSKERRNIQKTRKVGDIEIIIDMIKSIGYVNSIIKTGG